MSAHRVIHAGWLAALAIAVALATANTAMAQRTPPSDAELAAIGLAKRTLSVGGIQRVFLVQPPPADNGKPAPVIVLLHGGSQSMRKIFGPNAGGSKEWTSVARRENALLLVPNAMNASGEPDSDKQFWNDLRGGPGGSRSSTADDVGFILALLDWAHANYRTDRSRVYVTGASNGGQMTYRMLLQAPDRFAAGAAFISGMIAGAPPAGPAYVPTPLLIARGTEDPIIKWSGGKVGRTDGPSLMTAEETMSWWIAANRASPEAVIRTNIPDRDPDDGCLIERRVHAATKTGAPVEILVMRGGGHAMPSIKHRLPDNFIVRRIIGPSCRDAEGAELAWAFLSRHQRRPSTGGVTDRR